MTNTELQSDILIKEMITKQLKNIEKKNKFSYNDIQKISKNLNSSIFDDNDCSIWTGYITNDNKKNKGRYVNFYFNKKKTALRRLLYINFICDVSANEYIKYTCPNKGKCCNVNHMIKKKYKTKNKINIDDNNLNNKTDNDNIKPDSNINCNSDSSDNNLTKNKIIPKKITVTF